MISNCKSYINEHKCQHNFKDTIDPKWSCGLESETTFHRILRYKLYSFLRVELRKYNCTCVLFLKTHSKINLFNVLSYGSQKFSISVNKEILKSIIKCLKMCQNVLTCLFIDHWEFKYAFRIFFFNTLLSLLSLLWCFYRSVKSLLKAVHDF